VISKLLQFAAVIPGAIFLDPFSPSVFRQVATRPWLGVPIWVWPVVGCALLFFALRFIFGWAHKGRGSFYFDAQDYAHYEKANLGAIRVPLAAINGESTFAPLLENYISVTKLLITVAAASIAFAGNSNSGTGVVVGKIVLSFSVLYGVGFCAFLLYCYDEYGYNVHSYTPRWYKTVQAFGFSSLACFFVGYFAWALSLV
jgi:hypothetical protein